MNNYDLELGKVIERIKKVSARKVCIQLPDGLKPKAKKIVDEIEFKTSAVVLIWLGSCYGACDLPQGFKVDLLISWGHNVFEKCEGW